MDIAISVQRYDEMEKMGTIIKKYDNAFLLSRNSTESLSSSRNLRLNIIIHIFRAILTVIQTEDVHTERRTTSFVRNGYFSEQTTTLVPLPHESRDRIVDLCLLIK